MTMTEQGLTADFAVSLKASIDGLAAAVDRDRRRREDLAADIAYLELPAFSFTALPTAPGSTWGPNTGFNWAIQRITVAGLGATTDYVNVYRALVTAGAVGNNALYTIQQQVAGGLGVCSPGRTGLILKGDESIVLAGTFTGSTALVSMDAIQLTDDQLPFFLL